MKWIEALKVYNQGKGSWCIARKGTPEYDEVKRIMNSSKPEAVAKRNEERGEKAKEQLKEVADASSKRREEAKKKYAEKIAEMEHHKKKEAEKVVKAPAPAKENSFKDIVIGFLTNVLNGEPAEHKRYVSKLSSYIEGDDFYTHSWKSSVSYPITEIDQTHTEVEKEIDYKGGYTSGKGRRQIVAYVKASSFDLGHYVEDGKFELEPNPTPIEVSVSGLDGKYGNLPEKEALVEAIRLLKSIDFTGSSNMRWGRDYVEGVRLWAESRQQSQFFPLKEKDVDKSVSGLMRLFDNNNDLLVKFLKGKKLKGVTSKMKKDTLLYKMQENNIRPTEDDYELIANIIGKRQSHEPHHTPNYIKQMIDKAKTIV